MGSTMDMFALNQAELGRLCRRYRVLRLDLFGSAATGNFRPQDSDVDLLVEFEPLPPGAYADAYFGLLQSLEALVGASVDLVAEEAIKNPYFRQAVEQTKVLLYAA